MYNIGITIISYNMQEHLEPEDVFDPDYYKRVKLKADERAKIKLQNECEHIYFVCRCSKCNKVLGGEKHFKKIC